MTSPGRRSGPTVRRILLGAQLRRLREAHQTSRSHAGETVGASESKIGRMELGRAGFQKRDINTLLDLYGVSSDEDRGRVLELASRADQPGWWHIYSDLLPDWFASYVDLEAVAGRVRTYELQFVPGLLQTPGYARAVITQGHPGAEPGDIERRIQLRMARTQLLTRPDPPRLWAVIDEAVLRRSVGSDAVMRTQLEHLIQAAKLPTITLQVMPFRLGVHAAEGGAFTLLRFPDPELFDVVYLEQLTGASYLDARSAVDRYTEAMEQLCVQAETPNASIDLITDILNQT